MIDLVKIEAMRERSLISVDTPHGRFAIAQVGGSFYLFADSCTHASCPLSEGVLSGSVLTCDCHFSEFDVSNGRVLTEPAETDLVVIEIAPRDDVLSVEEEHLIEIGGA